MKKLALIVIVTLSAYSSLASALTLASSAFEDGGPIPPQYTCDGGNVQPELHWTDVPSGTQSLALVVDDIDAPNGVFNHWLVFNIPATVSELASNRPLPNGATQGINTWGRENYRGPCPPDKEHRYIFKLYALDTILSLQPGANAQQFETAANQHILGEAELMGKYQRSH